MANALPEPRHPPIKQPGQARGPRRFNGLAMDVASAAQFLGGSPKQLRSLVARKLVPHHRIGSRIIFVKTELEQWLSTLPGVTVEQAKQNQQTRQI